MPAWIRKMFGLKPKLKAKVPNFKNSNEYFEWRHTTYGEPLPPSIVQNKLEIKHRLEQQELQRQSIMDNARDRQAQKKENRAKSIKTNTSN